MSEQLKATHVQKAMLTFTRDELRSLIDGLDCLRGPERLRDHDALRARLVFAADSLPPTGGVR